MVKLTTDRDWTVDKGSRWKQEGILKKLEEL